MSFRAPSPFHPVANRGAKFMRRVSRRLVITGNALLASALAIASSACDSSSSTGSEFGSGGGGDQATGGASGGLGLAGNMGAGGTIGSGDSGALEDGELGDACGQTTIKGSSKEVDVLLVIDKSGS